MRLLFFFILAAGIGNTVLRLEIDNPVTLYRLVAPLGLLAIFVARPLMTSKATALFIAFAAYNFLLATIYGGGYSELGPSLVHYLYLSIPLVMMIYMKFRYEDFDDRYLGFVKWFYLFLLANLVLEMLVGSYWPNLYDDESDDGSVRAFFWNQNDLAVVLCVIAWIVLALDRYSGKVKVAVVLVTAFLLFKNDSKAALLSLVLISLPVWVIFRICAVRRISARVWVVLFGTLFIVGIGSLAAFSDVAIHFATDTYTIGDLLVKPVMNIATLQDSGEALGSINNRTDAAIYVIIEYLKSYGIGLGAGGSWLVLALPQYHLGGAESPHNAILQFIVDFGYPVLLGYGYLLYWAVRNLFKYGIAEAERLRVMAILSFPMLGLSQSGAIVTNYFFFAGVYFVGMYGRKMYQPALAGREKGGAHASVLKLVVAVGASQ
jgi:hypothetical protein